MRSMRDGGIAPNYPNGRKEIMAVPQSEVGQRIGLPADQGTLGLHRESHRGTLARTEWHDDAGYWYRSYGNENWEFNDDGLMTLTVCVHQRPAHCGSRAQISLAARAAGPMTTQV